MMKIPVIVLLLFLWQTGLAQQGMGGGEYPYVQDFPCLTDKQRSEIQAALEENISKLKEIDILPAEYSQQTVLFDWPLAPAPGLNDYGYHGVSNFVDQNPSFPNQILDYNCGNRTYDLPSGYNHRGIDYFNWPFLWYKMDHDEVMVVAAAPGVIILKQDGNYDRNCGLNSDPWNAIYLQHADGSVSWYGHMKNGSLTTKSIGDSVDTGEFLGIVGSSGSSTGPHLHFEVHNQFGDLIEPYQGPCNIYNSISWWISQRPYYDSAINKLMTHSAPPVFPECPQQEILNEKNNFAPGETVYVAAYYRDQLNSQVSEYYILRPDSLLFASWTHASNATYYAASYWYWYWPLPINAPQGVWTFKVIFEGQTYTHDFTVGLTSIEEEQEKFPLSYSLQQNYPNPFNPETVITYSLRNAGFVTLKIYNSLGQEVITLRKGRESAGIQSLKWDGRDASGKAVSGGMYFYRLVAGGYSETRQMQLIK